MGNAFLVFPKQFLQLILVVCVVPEGGDLTCPERSLLQLMGLAKRARLSCMHLASLFSRYVVLRIDCINR